MDNGDKKEPKTKDSEKVVFHSQNIKYTKAAQSANTPPPSR